MRKGSQNPGLTVYARHLSPSAPSGGAWCRGGKKGSDLTLPTPDLPTAREYASLSRPF